MTARTSSFFFKDKNIPVPEIAGTLGVKHIVEVSPALGLSEDVSPVALRTIKFSSCSAGTAMYDSTMGFGQGTNDFVRLTWVAGLSCP